MQVTKIKVSGFKSLVDFELELTKFMCLIGLNGSGKSTILQFIDFLSQLMRGDMEGWFKERHWEVYDVNSKLFSPSKHTVDFTVEAENSQGYQISWEARYNSLERKCTYETIKLRETVADKAPPRETLLLKADSQGLILGWPAKPGQPYTIRSGGKVPDKIAFIFQGSVLSQLKEEGLSAALKEFRSFFRKMNSFDMLAPQSLRRRDRESGGSIGLSDQWLSAFLHELGRPCQKELAEKLKKVYPHLADVFTRSLQSGWKRLSIQEGYGDRKMYTEARHVNDGMLRLIAFLTELESKHDFLLFDEIENGINPELVEFVIQVLTSARQQIMVTTHSPLILNYLDDVTACESVIYTYKMDDGKTRAIKFFDIPSLREKLTVMGPGEAFVDTDLTELDDEITYVAGTK